MHLKNKNLLTPKVIFEDQHLMVISKPAGLLSQGDISGEFNLVNWAREHVKRNYIGLIHRLDRNTSGLMVLGKRSKAANRLSESLKTGLLKRKYLALVEGSLQAQANWTHYLKKDNDINHVSVAEKRLDPSYKKSSLLVTPLKHKLSTKGAITLCEFILETGRSHQIRAQASFEGHPLLGDIKYGANQGFTSLVDRLALHSYSISFPHPMSDLPMHFEEELPEDLSRLI